MHLIWYNSDLKEYKFGNRSTYNQESFESKNPDAFTVLMALESGSNRLASKIIKQLNIASELPLMYAS